MNNYKIDWLMCGMVFVISLLIGGMAFGEYLSYLSTKQKYNIIQTAISKDWSIDQIQGLINSKQ